MSLYFILFGLFIVQEPVSSDAALLEAYQYHYNLWIIHGLFIVATLLDITVGYFLGAWLRRRFSDNRLIRYLSNTSRDVSSIAGRWGNYLFLFVWGPIIFPVSTLIAPWLDIPFVTTMIFMFLGELVFWYGSEWLIVLGVKSVIPDPLEALGAVLVVMLAISFALRYVKSRSQRSDT